MRWQEARWAAPLGRILIVPALRLFRPILPLRAARVMLVMLVLPGAPIPVEMTYEQRPDVSLPTGITLHARPTQWLTRPALAEDPRVFHPIYHETAVHVPHEVVNVAGDPDLAPVLDLAFQDCLSMPIRLAGQDVYSVPDNWAGLAPVLQHLVDVEHANNPNWVDYHAYLTVHYSPDIAPGVQQRRGGAHTDGFQGSRQDRKGKTGRNYVMVTNGGTRFYRQTFVAALDPARLNVFEGFDVQIRKDGNGVPVSESAAENIVYFFDGYTVHESGLASRLGSRLFLRLTFELAALDSPLNTRNGMLPTEWERFDYDIRTDLVTPTLADIEAARLIPEGMSPARVLVTGSGRATEVAHGDQIRQVLERIVQSYGGRHVVFVHGNMPGVDRVAAEFAEACIPNASHEPHIYRWTPGAATYPRQHEAMLASGIDQVVAFYVAEDLSRGTDDALEKAGAAGIPAAVHTLT
jgi:hypothetical protein